MSEFKVLPQTYILSPFSCFSKKRLFEEIGVISSAATGIKEKIFIDALNQREAMGDTVCAKGFALPHAIIRDLSSPIAVLAILHSEVPYNSVDADYVGIDMALAIFYGDKERKEDARDSAEEMLIMICEQFKNNDLANSFRRSWQDQNKLQLVLKKLDHNLYEQIKENAVQPSQNPIMQFITETIGGSTPNVIP